MAFGQPQQQMQMQAPMGMSGVGDSLNIAQRNMDAEFQKHILDVNPLQLAFYKVFSGWREVQYIEQRELFGKVKEMERTRMEVDRYSRIVNESCANYLFNAVVPLITPAMSTSHVKPMDIYLHWNGGLTPIEFTLVDAYHLPSFICTEPSTRHRSSKNEYYTMPGETCTFITSNALMFREHQRNDGHEKYIKVINPYEMNMERYPEIITKLCNLALITMKAKEGFTLKELAENYFTASMVRNGIVPPQQQQGGFRPFGGLFGR